MTPLIWLLEPNHPRDLADVKLCRLVLVLFVLIFGPLAYRNHFWALALLVPALHIGLIQSRIRFRRMLRNVEIPPRYQDWYKNNLPTNKDLKIFIDEYARDFGWNDSQVKVAVCKYLDEQFCNRKRRQA